MTRSRPAIPEHIKRKVRQRCGFGCVCCGSPIYDYDHIDQYSRVLEHCIDNLTLLCPTCHRKKTNGVLSKERVTLCNAAASKRMRTYPEKIPLEYYSLDVGGNDVNTFSGVVFNIWGVGFFQIDFKGGPVINSVILDERGQPAIEIKESEYTLSCSTWDIEYVGMTLVFRHAPRKIFFKIKIDGNNKKIEVRGRFRLPNGVVIKIEKDGIFLRGKLLASSNTIERTNNAFIVTEQTPELTIGNRGSFKDNFLYGQYGIAALDCFACERNFIMNCDFAFVWQKDFLARFQKSC